MLGIQKPIMMTTGAGMLTLSDTFGEKIRANYTLMASNFMPKDLLFLLVNPPDALPPEAASGIEIENHFAHTQQIILDVVNNVVNRVLLEDRSTLTYQDRVYVDMALHKFGVENVALFMKQVKALREENLSVFRLLSLYGEHYHTLVRSLEQAPSQTQKPPGRTQDREAAEDSERRLYLHNEIFSRLDTAALYRELQHYTHSAVQRSEILDRRELTIAEQSRLASVITLQSYKSRIFPSVEPAVIYHRNFYESGELLPPPATEKQVLEQAASSSLLQVIDNVMVTRIAHYMTKQDIWLDIRSALSQSAQNSLSRFVSFREDHYSAHSAPRYELTRMTPLYQQEAEAVARYLDTLHVRQHQGQSRHEVERLYNAQRTLLSGGEQTHESERTLRETLISDTLAPIGPAVSWDVTRQGDRSDSTIIQRHTHAGDSMEVTYAGDRIEARQEIVPPRRSDSPIADETALREALSAIDARNRERMERVQQAQAETSEKRQAPRPDVQRIQRDALRALEQPEQVLAEVRRQTQQTAPPADPRVAALLSQTDETTRRMLEAVQLLQRDPAAAARMGVTAADGPAALSAEIAAVERERLALTQHRERETQERVTEREILRSEHRRESVREDVQAAVRAEEDVITHETSRLLYERLADEAHVRPAVRGQSEQHWEAGVPIIHRRTETQNTEELIRRQERQTSEKTTHKESHVETIESHAEQAQIHNVTQELVTQTREDVTEMVNKALRRQIGAISDKVYSQLERRLQGERARRGRF